MTKNQIENIVAAHKSVAEYEGNFDAHCTEDRPRLGTGYLPLDMALNGGLSNELYILGAETSTGKSAFMMSIAENIVAAGTADVLYFALEMGTDEFIARGISRCSFEAWQKDHNATKFVASEILNWTYDNISEEFTRIAPERYAPYKAAYFKGKEHLHIFESGIDSWTVRDIANVATTWKTTHPDRQVVVFIDYLQLISSDPAKHIQDRKSKTDDAVFKLKCLASQIGMPVFTASSINRSSYKGLVTANAFKESGDIEYTGGILIGWNWLGVTNSSDDVAREEEKKKCMARGYREMVLEVLKSRNSAIGNKVTFYYYPGYNYFATEGTFRPALDNKEIPFENAEPQGRTIFC